MSASVLCYCSQRLWCSWHCLDAAADLPSSSWQPLIPLSSLYRCQAATTWLHFADVADRWIQGIPLVSWHCRQLCLRENHCCTKFLKVFIVSTHMLEVRTRTGQQTMDNVLRERRLRWLGHVFCMGHILSACVKCERVRLYVLTETQRSWTVASVRRLWSAQRCGRARRGIHQSSSRRWQGVLRLEGKH